MLDGAPIASTLTVLLSRGWIESRNDDHTSFQITEAGRAVLDDTSSPKPTRP